VQELLRAVSALSASLFGARVAGSICAHGIVESLPACACVCACMCVLTCVCVCCCVWPQNSEGFERLPLWCTRCWEHLCSRNSGESARLCMCVCVCFCVWPQNSVFERLPLQCMRCWEHSCSQNSGESVRLCMYVCVHVCVRALLCLTTY
jgi:hypothetical protein